MDANRPRLPRRGFLSAVGGALLAGPAGALAQRNPASSPNVVIILCDDLGYGDVHAYGSNIPTPNIDEMANEGVRFDQFYAASAVCSPSRAALLTGRYAPRVGVPDVINPQDAGGLSLTETTMGDMLKSVGYKTMCVGKWHLGSKDNYLPTYRGFDDYYGIPYSNDQSPSILMRNATIIETPVDLTTITQRYTQQAVNFINRSSNSPFFLYFAHTFPHIPLAASTAFKGSTGMGLYADTVSEIDWSVGQVLQALKDNSVDNNTLTIFTSDNGPWFQGSPGKLRGRKGWTYEGGFREPFIARFPGRINGTQNAPSKMSYHPPVSSRTEFVPRSVNAVATMMDLFPTIAGLCNAKLPAKPLDGVNIWPLMTGDQTNVSRDIFLYFDGWNVQCARMGPWKLHVSRYNDFPFNPDPVGGRINLPLPQPELYNLDRDPDESYDIAADNQAVVASILARITALLPTFPTPVMNAWKVTTSRRTTGFEGSLPVPIP